jgi:murein DD-endopeptidase MepM/ murein hydrolase activator NlpD
VAARPPSAGAGDGAGWPATECLEQAAASLEREASLLESLWTVWRGQEGEGAESAAHYLAGSQVRVWRWRVETREVVATGLVGSVPADWEEGIDGFPPLGSLGIETGPAALADHWVTYRAALARVLGIQEGLAAWAVAHTTGLPTPGRVCPVDGPVRFSPTWGEERPWGRTHKGEDLHADPGTPLVAVESGTILQAGWHWQGGFGIWLAGDYSGDVYYYAHLAWMPREVRPGATVEVGELLGWVGSTGNATSPHLHFGWIPDSNGPWPDLAGLADPYPLLFGLCR